MQLSNGFYPSATHRVTLPQKVVPSGKPGEPGHTKDRYSIPFFVCPDGDAEVAVPPSLIRDGEAARYEKTTINKYGKEKFESLYGR